MEEFEMSPDIFFNLKDPAKIVAILNLSNQLVETGDDDLYTVGSIVSMILMNDIVSENPYFLPKKTTLKLVPKFYKVVQSEGAVNLEDVIHPEHLMNERVLLGSTLLLSVPHAIGMLAEREGEGGEDTMSKLSLMYAVLHLFDEIYDSSLASFFDNLYIEDAEEKDEAFYRKNLLALFSEKPDLF